MFLGLVPYNVHVLQTFIVSANLHPSRSSLETTSDSSGIALLKCMDILSFLSLGVGTKANSPLLAPP